MEHPPSPQPAALAAERDRTLLEINNAIISSAAWARSRSSSTRARSAKSWKTLWNVGSLAIGLVSITARCP
jgi:hypothetical protein